MSYDQKLQKILRFVPPAVDAVFAEYAEAAISWDKEKVITALVAKLKLDLPDLNSGAEAFNAVEAALATLLMSGKIQPKAFGYSSLGNEEVNLLFAKYAPTEVAAQKTPEDEYSDIKHDYLHLSSLELQTKKNRTAGYLQRFNEAVQAGVI